MMQSSTSSCCAPPYSDEEALRARLPSDRWLRLDVEPLSMGFAGSLFIDGARAATSHR